MSLSGRDELFFRFALGALVVLILYGAGMVAVILTDASDTIAKGMITGFSGMFGLIIGLGSGYLLGTAKSDDA